MELERQGLKHNIPSAHGAKGSIQLLPSREKSIPQSQRQVQIWARPRDPENVVLQRPELGTRMNDDDAITIN